MKKQLQSRIIAVLEYNNDKYAITQLKNQLIFSVIESARDIKLDGFTNQELQIFHHMCNAISVRKKNTNWIESVRIRHRRYDIYYDEVSDNYFWETKEDCPNINKFLNFNYQHQTEVAPSGTFPMISQSSDFYKKFIKIGKKICVLLISASISLNSLTSCNIWNNTLNKEKYKIEHMDQDIAYNYQEIHQAISENPYLKEEKQLLYKLKFLFDENYQYMDLDLVINRLKTLQVEYANDEVEVTKEMTIVGKYSAAENRITLHCQNFEEANLTTFIHEFLHVLQSPDYSNYMGELSNECFAREIVFRLFQEDLLEKERFLDIDTRNQYQNKTLKIETEEEWLYYIRLPLNGYENHLPLYYILAEIIPAESLRYYQFHPKETKVLIETLETICIPNGKENNMAYQTIKSINDLRAYSIEKEAYIYQDDINSCVENLEYYFSQKYQKSFQDDLNCQLYLIANSAYSTEEAKKYILEYHNLDMVRNSYYIIPKYYFTNSKDTLNLVYKIYSLPVEHHILEITPEIQQEYPKIMETSKRKIKKIM